MNEPFPSDSPNPDRRRFLQGRLGAEKDQAPDSEQLDTPKNSYLIELSRKAMACQFEILLRSDGPASETEAAIDGLDVVDELEQQLSAYRYDSELSRLNATAAIRPIQIEPRMFELLQLSTKLSERTGGAFDITSGPLTKVWGFFQRQGRVPDPTELAAAQQSVGWSKLVLDAEKCSVSMQEGTELNLGSIGKGYAVDRCREVMHDAGVANFMINGGTSSVLASGSRHPDGQGWQVGVPHPVKKGQRMGTVYLREEALGTSGAAFQAFYEGGRRYGHVLDPRSGQPVSEVLSATVIAPTATEADALATACYVMGEEETRGFLEQKEGIAVLLVKEGRQRGSVELVQLGGMKDRLNL